MSATTPKHHRFIGRQQFSRIVISLTAFVVLLIVFYPFLFAMMNSFKTQLEAQSTGLIPFVQFNPTLQNWQNEFGPGAAKRIDGLKNSASVALGATSIATSLGTLAGYALARYRFGRNNSPIVFVVLLQRFVPPVATLLAYFLVLQRLNLLDSVIGLIIVNATFTLPFAVLITRDAFAELPRDLLDATLVDGGNHWQAFRHVALPLSKPAIAASAIIAFTFSWNEFLFATVLTNLNAQTYMLQIIGGGGIGTVAARILIAVALPVLLSLFAQRYIVRGLTLGAVHG